MTKLACTMVEPNFEGCHYFISVFKMVHNLKFKVFHQLTTEPVIKVNILGRYRENASFCNSKRERKGGKNKISSYAKVVRH